MEQPPSSSPKSQESSDPTSPLPPSVSRLWRPAAQRNLRNQWSKLSSFRQKWDSSSSAGRSHATSLVNAYLSRRYMQSMEFGALRDMHGIQEKACLKLFRQQECHRHKLLSSYKEMVAVVTQMFSASRSMRCYLKGACSSPLVQFSSSLEHYNGVGDGGELPVFTFWSISSFENLALELVQMFALEVILKRLLIVVLLSIRSEEEESVNVLGWEDELYSGEFADLSICNLCSMENSGPVPPRINGWEPNTLVQSDCRPKSEILQVYLTIWLADLNVDTHRVEEIFAIVGGEMHVSFV